MAGHVACHGQESTKDQGQGKNPRMKNRPSRMRGQLLFLNARLPGVPPGLHLRFVSVNRSSLLMKMATNWQALFGFPAVDGAHVPLKVRRNFLPGIQAIASRRLGWRGPWERLLATHADTH